jgi:hypothetical protein
MKAWLVTWEWCGDHARREDTIAAVFNPRLGAERVRELVEFIYASEYSIAERLALARGGPNPYPAEFVSINGVRWQGEMLCGHNPYLRARLVDDLAVERNVDGKEILSWKERPQPSLGRVREEVSR